MTIHVIATPDDAIGFALAGLSVHACATGDEVRRAVAAVDGDASAGLLLFTGAAAGMVAWRSGRAAGSPGREVARGGQGAASRTRRVDVVLP